jgi:hypothetical protein
MMRSLLTIILIFCTITIGNAQSPKISFKDINYSNWPLLDGNLWVRNPDGLKNKNVYFVENGTKIKVDFTDKFENSDSVAKNKAVIFILLFNPNDPRQFKWHQGVLKAAIEKTDFKSGDQYTVFFFNNQRNGKFLYPLSWKFTDNKEEFIRMIDDLAPTRNDYVASLSTECNILQRHLIRHAAGDAMDILIKEVSDTFARGVFILADDKFCSAVPESEDTYTKAQNNNIANYAISYDKSGASDFIKGFCNSTYGEYYKKKYNKAGDAAKKLIEFLSDFNQRHAGVVYKGSYNTSIENKDGSPKSIKIESEESNAEFILDVPNKSFFEQIQASILWILLVLVSLFFFIYLFKSNNKKKQEQINQVKKENEIAIQEIEQKRQQEEIESKRREQEIKNNIENKLNEQENRRKQEEAKRKQLEDEIKRQKNSAEINDILMAQMRERGNMAWLEYSGPNGSGRIDIDVPEITFGRDKKQVDYALDHATVSRQHIKIYYSDYKYFIMDLGSSNGTFLNGFKISKSQLNHGDLINIGEITINFYI